MFWFAQASTQPSRMDCGQPQNLKRYDHIITGRRTAIMRQSSLTLRCRETTTRTMPTMPQIAAAMSRLLIVLISKPMGQLSNSRCLECSKHIRLIPMFSRAVHRYQPTTPLRAFRRLAVHATDLFARTSMVDKRPMIVPRLTQHLQGHRFRDSAHATISQINSHLCRGDILTITQVGLKPQACLTRVSLLAIDLMTPR